MDRREIAGRSVVIRVMSLVVWIGHAALGVFAFDAAAQISVSGPSTPGPATVMCTNIQLSQRVPCPDSELRFYEGRRLVQVAYNARDFKALDDLYEQWCSGRDRFPDGTWKLSQFADGFAENFSAWKTWSLDLAALKKWQASRPQSNAALYIEAVYWREYAWNARGSGYTHTVSREAWELFRERLIHAKSVLDTLRQRQPDCAAPYVVTLNVLTDLGTPENELQAVFREGTRKFPEYHRIYFAMARHYEPRWGGTAEQYEAFANQVADATRRFEGMGMYARIYWLVDATHNIPFRNDPLQPPKWDKLRAGYEDLMRLYPSSITNLGKYLDVACRSHDSVLYRALRTKIAGYEQTVKMVDNVDVCDRRHRWVAAR